MKQFINKALSAVILMAVTTPSLAQNLDEEKKKINSIKKDRSYLYAEITTPDAGQSKALAEDMLLQE